ncbi:MAG TPA: hypothetical protein VGO66_01265 [Solirubrobacterales bacterium]|nr:hypothetical protein [Solirubrobacterales bacterium]
MNPETVFRGRVIEVAMKRYSGPDGEYERDVVEHPRGRSIGADRSLEIPVGTLDSDDGSELE